MTTVPPLVGQQLAKRRDQLDMTQELLARRIGITSATVSATERGKTVISRSKRPAWEQALRLRSGTIGRAYREGSRIEPLDEGPPAEPYADLSDPHERVIWERTSMSEEDRRDMIDMIRVVKAQPRHD